MSDQVEGIVKKITEKAARGGSTIYNVCIDTGNEDEWFGHGFDEPQFSEGDEIAFAISYNGEYANVDTNTVEIISEGSSAKRSNRSSPSRSNSRSSRSSSRSSSSKPVAKKPYSKANSADTKMSKEEWAQKDKMIQLQSAMNTAIALVSVAVANDLVALPAKKADKFDAFCALVDEEAERLHEQYREQVYGAPKQAKGRGRDEYDDDIPY